MQVFNAISEIPAAARGAVVAIGNFDGLHRGHRALLDQAAAIAQRENTPLGVLSFEPHPRSLFRPDDPPFRLTPRGLKQERLAAAGIDLLFSLPFEWDFASQSAAAFIKNVLDDAIAPSHIVVGPDFHFGQLRKGSAADLSAAGYPVTAAALQTDASGEVISSSRIRAALRHGDLDAAHDLLGWRWEMRGPVVPGDRRGRELGYPTANIPLGQTLHPSYGVYATWVKIIEDGPEAPWHRAATNIGIRPMFEVAEGQIEAYIFDFDRDIYGRTLRVVPAAKLRGEAKFESLEALITQIDADCAEARKILQDAPE